MDWINALISLITPLVKLFQKPKIDIILGETVDFVCHPRHYISGFHLESTFINPSPKTAVITRINLHFKIYLPGNGSQTDCDAQIAPTFFVKHQDTLEALPNGPVHHLVVEKNAPISQSMQFDIPAHAESKEYTFNLNYRTIDFELLIWINNKRVPEKPKVFRCVISDGGGNQPGTYQRIGHKLDLARVKTQAQLCPIPIQILN